MKPPPPPIRFLLAVVGCWVGVRAMLLWPGGAVGGGEAPAAAGLATPTAGAASAPRLPSVAGDGSASTHWPAPGWQRSRAWPAVPPLPAQLVSRASVLAAAPAQSHASFPPLAGAVSFSTAAPPFPRLAYPPLAPATPPLGAEAAAVAPGRWSGSAWLFVRREAGEPGLAPGGTLGGSQAGARLAYRVNGDARRPLALSGRLYLPLERPQGAEVALGVDWKPIAELPLHILAERRQRIGREGRSDFSVTVYGGGERRLLRDRLRVEAYGQAGVVGVRERDLFADGSIRASTPIGPLEVGAGAWGGAQPGAARLDVGPQASFRIPVGRTAIRASAEWRFRVAGDAAPGSGPAFTLATDF